MNELCTPAPSVSILVASYNYAHFLPDALDSILAQTTTDWETIIIDDGSSDQSIQLIKNYVKKDSRFKLLQHANGSNRGLAATLQLGLSMAQAPLIGFLEADDQWKPNALEERRQFLDQHPGASVVFDLPDILQQSSRSLTYYEELFAILQTIHKRRKNPRITFIEMLAMNLIPTFSCALVKREDLHGCSFNSPIGPLLDKWLWQQLSLHKGCFFLNRTNTIWRFHETSYMIRQPSEIRTDTNKVFATATRQLLQSRCLSQGDWAGWLALQWMEGLGMGVRIWLKFRAMGGVFLWRLIQRRLPLGSVS